MLKTVFGYIKHYLKRTRSYYYFGRFDSFVHGRIQVGSRRNVSVGSNCSINAGVIIQGHTSIVVGNNVVLSPNVMLLDAGLDFGSLVQRGKRIHIGQPVTISNGCWIGAGAIVLPGVTLGENVLVGAGSVVTRSFPANCVVTGNPAKKVRDLSFV